MGNLQAQVYDLLNVFFIVKLSTHNAFGVVSHVKLLAQVTTGRIFHKTDVAGSRQIEHPSFFSFRFCLGNSCLQNAPGQSGQIGFIGKQHFKPVSFFQVVLPKIEGCFAQLHRQLPVGFLVFSRKCSSAILELFVVFFHQTDLFGE